MKKVNTSDEINRLKKMLEFENSARSQGYQNIAGIDEAGRGPLAGPVVAACCILKEESIILELNDSKKLTQNKREKIYDEILDNAMSWGIGMADNMEIDEINILNATKLAMLRAVEAMDIRPDILLVDAVKLENLDIPQITIVKGDLLSQSIAAASILAKVTRDRLMRSYCKTYPVYQFEKHKGYGTKAHYEAIREFGITPIHRKTFTKGYW